MALLWEEGEDLCRESAAGGNLTLALRSHSRHRQLARFSSARGEPARPGATPKAGMIILLA